MTGTEWLVDARGCDPIRLRSQGTLAALFDRMCEELHLRPVEPALWHLFPGEGGITGLLLLAESHLTVHTFPETCLLTLNLYCCRPRPEWPFAERLAEMVGASRVEVRTVLRGKEEQ